VDTDSLSAQVAEKQERERLEKQRDLYHGWSFHGLHRLMMMTALLLLLLWFIDDLAVTHAKTITDQANTVCYCGCR
jgi:hypothetical protein